jgi:hypothetical protein
MQILDFRFSPLDIVTLPPEEGRMAAKKDQFADLNGRIDALRDELRTISRPKSWPAKLYELAINHKGTSIILAIVLCIVSIVGGGYFKYWLDHKDEAWNSRLDGRIDTILSSKGGIKESLANVQQTVSSTDNTLKTLAPFIQDVIRHQFENASKLPTATLRERLPGVRNLLAVAKNQDVKIEPGIAASLSKKLLQIQPDASDFWQVAGALISYRSSLLVGSSRNWAVINFPPCPNTGTVDLDSTPNASAQALGPDGKPTGQAGRIQRIGYQDCYVELDGRKISRWDCKRCLIRYSGGPLSMRDVRFQDCLFVFDFGLGQPPSPDGQRLSETLLASGLKDVTIPASGDIKGAGL